MEWIDSIREVISVTEIAKICNRSERTIRDWQKEKFQMDFECFEKVSKVLKKKIPEVQKVPRYVHTKDAGKKGAATLLKRYGKLPIDEKKRKEKWDLWWKTKGRYKRLPDAFHAKKVHIPSKSKKLAEFIGIMIGDGSVTPYHVAVTLNAEDDKEYVEYVAKLVENLFHIQPHLYKREAQNTINIVVTRKLASLFLQDLGLPVGDKVRSNTSIPNWILDNKIYARACARGLMDTDGSVFMHSYTSKGKRYVYKKLSFTSAVPKLILQMRDVLKENNIVSHIQGKNLRIGAASDVKRYFTVFGSSNPKHLKRWLK